MTVCANYGKPSRKSAAEVPHRVVLFSDSSPHYCDNKGNLISHCQTNPVPGIVFGIRPFLLPRFGQAFGRQNTDDKMLLYQCIYDYNIFSPICQGGFGEKVRNIKENGDYELKSRFLLKNH